MSSLSYAAQAALEALLNSRPLATEDDFAVKVRKHSEAITALRAALAQEQAEPDLSRCPKCNGPADNGFDRSFPPSPYICKKCMAEPGAWVASPDGRVIYDDISADDGLLRVSGDFANDELRIRYAQRIVDALNAAPPRRTMLPLTEREIGKLTAMFDARHSVRVGIARAIEKASWEKNHG